MCHVHRATYLTSSQHFSHFFRLQEMACCLHFPFICRTKSLEISSMEGEFMDSSYHVKGLLQTMQTLLGRLDLATVLPAALDPFFASTRIVLNLCTLNDLAVSRARPAVALQYITQGRTAPRACPKSRYILYIQRVHSEQRHRGLHHGHSGESTKPGTKSFCAILPEGSRMHAVQAGNAAKCVATLVPTCSTQPKYLGGPPPWHRGRRL